MENTPSEKEAFQQKDTAQGPAGSVADTTNRDSVCHLERDAKLATAATFCSTDRGCQ